MRFRYFCGYMYRRVVVTFVIPGGKTILPLVIQGIPQMLGHHDWKQRYAALMALSAIGEGCNKQMESMLNEIIKGVPGVIEGIIR